MIGIFITARLGSTRLSQKHLIESAGQSFIGWLISRFAEAFAAEIKNGSIKIFITTSVLPENKKFEKACKGYPVEVFYGSDENIPLRHLQCATANGINHIISVDGDDILCSTTAARVVLEKMMTGAGMAQTTGLPLGMNMSGYTRDFLKASLSKEDHTKLETGWGRIFDKEQVATFAYNIPDSDKIRMTLDYELDADFFSTVIASVGDEIINIRDEALIQAIIENGWFRINDCLNKVYWQNFQEKKGSE